MTSQYTFQTLFVVPSLLTAWSFVDMCTGQTMMSNQLLAHIHHSMGTFSRYINRRMMFHSPKKKPRDDMSNGLLVHIPIHQSWPK